MPKIIIKRRNTFQTFTFSLVTIQVHSAEYHKLPRTKYLFLFVNFTQIFLVFSQKYKGIVERTTNKLEQSEVRPKLTE